MIALERTAGAVLTIFHVGKDLAAGLLGLEPGARSEAPRPVGPGALSDADVEAHHTIMSAFVEVWCRDHHAPADGAPCEECRELLDYARGRLERCPYSPKPACRACPSHCYNTRHRARVREVMRYSGMYFVKRGRIDWLVKYFLLEGRR